MHVPRLSLIFQYNPPSYSDIFLNVSWNEFTSCVNALWSELRTCQASPFVCSFHLFHPAAAKGFLICFQRDWFWTDLECRETSAGALLILKHYLQDPLWGKGSVSVPGVIKRGVHPEYLSFPDTLKFPESSLHREDSPTPKSYYQWHLWHR